MPRLHREWVGWILDRVAAGELSVGDRLPREVDLQKQWGVSRGVVREVMRALEERGVVVVRHGVPGATVAPIEAWNFLGHDVARAVLAGRSGVVLLHELVECRELVERRSAACGDARR